ncbi:TetR/AcrR family transcriptional regulator [Affinibrenneria salicis]|uniref:TetR/AcrR family transcriptional regulator n=1 Tax=Affinibrenneria salicis TaxID=2590031 RepID=A0A5J5G1N6_9GAMM|nr:TetR/AcrR family transcriptional regulator [Affinibrenneria salicis]KAA9000634.1 TetR/AcrR family transcriptional regulator [Affinibrenneria salicis]
MTSHPAAAMADKKASKIHARRDQIVAAARQCFRQSGFHAAGMAEIARRSQLSVGQIYRYFVNKDAIIEEIVRRIVNNRIQILTLADDHAAQMAHELALRILAGDEATREDDRALMLEASAEATRNPKVAHILQEADARLFHQASAMLRQRYPQLSAEQIAARVELVAVLSEGTAFRAFTAQQASPEALNQLYRHLLQQLFPPA